MSSSKVNLLFASLAVASLTAGFALGPRLGLERSPSHAKIEAPASEGDTREGDTRDANRLSTNDLSSNEPAAVAEEALVDDVPPAEIEPIVDPLNPTADPDRAWLIAEGPQRARDNGRRLVTLTYDDGPGPASTPALLKELDRFGVKATFFLIGEYLTGKTPRADKVRAAARQIVEKGHGLGSHSLNHRLLTIASKSEVVRQIDEAHERITAATGASPQYFRPPYGGLDAFGSGLVRAHGYTLVLWSVEAQDMVRNDEDGVFEDIRRQLEYAEGGVVLLHDIKMQTVRVTHRLLDYLQRRRFDPEQPQHVGFEIVDLATYLRETAERPQPFDTRAALAQARLTKWRKARAGHKPQKHNEPGS